MEMDKNCFIGYIIMAIMKTSQMSLYDFLNRQNQEKSEL